MNEVKICKDCKHCIPLKGFVFWFGEEKWRFSKCARTLKQSSITGEVNGSYCENERELGECGPEGKHWEARQ